MDPRTLQEIDETAEPARLVLPAGYPAHHEFDWGAGEIDGWTEWKMWIKRNAGATTTIDYTPDVTQQAAGIIIFDLTVDQVTTAAGFGDHAVWGQSAKAPDGILVPLWAGPVIIDRKARR